MENLFISLGLSYTSAKLIPYIIFSLLGIVIGIILIRKFKGKILLTLLAVLGMFVPFIIYFFINPIYQGDFSNDYRSIAYVSSNDELKGEKLVIISLPGCDFCKATVPLMKKVVEQHPELKVEYLLASSDERNLAFFTDEIQGAFPIRLSEAPSQIAKIANGRFPTFVLVDDDEALKVWSNDQFGVRALDEVIDQLD